MVESSIPPPPPTPPTPRELWPCREIPASVSYEHTSPNINKAIWTISHIRPFLTCMLLLRLLRGWGERGGREGRGAIYYPHWEIPGSFPEESWLQMNHTRATLLLHFQQWRQVILPGQHFSMTVSFLHDISPDCAWCAQELPPTPPPPTPIRWIMLLMFASERSRPHHQLGQSFRTDSAGCGRYMTESMWC